MDESSFQHYWLDKNYDSLLLFGFSDYFKNPQISLKREISFPEYNCEVRNGYFFFFRSNEHNYVSQEYS